MPFGICPLSDRGVENIHDKTLQLLNSFGICLHSEYARELFRSRGAKVDGLRVFIPPTLMEEALSTVPASFLLHARNPEKSLNIGRGLPAAVASSSGVAKVVDEQGIQRTVTFDDFKRMLKLTQTSPVLNLTSTHALYPEANNVYETILKMMYYTLSMTDLPYIGTNESCRLAEASIDMVRCVTGCDIDKHFVLGICNSLSPMGWAENMLDAIRIFAAHNQPLNITCCSMSGATAPIYKSGHIVQNNAEVLAGIAYAQLIRPGTPVIYGTTSSVIDMTTMGLSLGTPEYTLLSAAGAQLADYYNIPYRSGGGLTDAKVMDGQAGMESAMNLTFSLLCGVDFLFQSVGILESFMSLGFDKWIMDEEIISRLEFIRKGLTEVPEDLQEVIADGVDDGSFLYTESSVADFRKELYFPMLADRRNFTRWKESGEDFRSLAWKKVHAREESYVCPALSAEEDAELVKCMARHM